MKSKATRKHGESTRLTGEELGQRLLASIRELKAGKVGRITKVSVNEVAQARHRTGLSQSEFAHALHISCRTLQEWEQGRRKPSGPAQVLIRIAQNHPKVVRALIQ